MKKVKRRIKKYTVATLNMASNWKDDQKLKVLIRTWPSFSETEWADTCGKELEYLKRYAQIVFAPNRFNYLKNLREADVIFTNSADEEFNVLKLKLLQIAQSSLDYKEKYLSMGIRIVTSRGLSKHWIAEYVLSAIMYIIKDMSTCISNQKNKLWEQQIILKNTKSIKEIRVGLLGCGEVGLEISKLLSALQIKQDIFDKNKKTSNCNYLSYYDDLMSMPLSEIDFLIIALPLNAETKETISSEILSKLNKGCYVINIARGELLVERHLLTAINENMIAGAILDVQNQEPLPPSSELWSNKNIIITPHIAGNLHLIKKEIMQRFIRNINAVLNNTELEGLLI